MSNVYQEYEPPVSSGGMYLKLEDGDTVKIRIASEPVIFDSEFKDPSGDVKISTKYAWKVWNRGEETAQVFSVSLTTYKKIANLAADEDYGDPTGYDLKITREGKGTETQYHVTPGVKREPLDKEAIAKIEDMDLISAIQKSPSALRVALLSDVVKNGREQVDQNDLPTHDVNKDLANAAEEDREDNEPIDLSTIPF